jgi:hypothetical protein
MGRSLALSLVVLGACGGDSTERAERATGPGTTPEALPVEEAEGGPEPEPLPLLAAHPPPPPLAPPGCRFRDEEGELGEAVAGLDFRVTFRSGRGRYHQGETIGLALSFSARTPDTFQLDAAEYDRAGRLHIDQYALDPSEGAVDPLADYYDRGPIEMGGIREMPMLGRRPRVIERDLDEYLQIRRPGRYRLRVATDRVSREGAPIVCATEPLELEILPADDARNVRSLEEAVRVLERDAGLAPEARTDADEAAASRAAVTLRYLTTEAAAEAMVRFLATGENDSWGFDLMMGLYGSPHRPRIVELMGAALREPTARITTSFVDTLARLTEQLEQPGYLPPWPEDEPSQRRWRATEAAHLARRLAVEDRYAARLLESLPNKEGTANDVAFATLLELAFRRAEAPSWIRDLRSQIGARLPTMEESAQDRFLRDRWLQIADASLVGPLRAMADAESTEPGTRALALARLFELAPAEGQRRIEAEIRRVPLRLGYRGRETLSVLVGPIPALDEALAAGVERMDHEQDVRAHLLAKYGTPAILSRVRAALAARRDRSSSEAEGAYWAYLLRVDHDRAVRDLAARASQASTDMDERRLAAELASAADYLWDPALEAQLVALLSSEDAQTVTASARVLQENASARAERSLFARLDAHHARYERRPAEGNTGEPWQIEEALVSALLRGRGWHLDRAALERLRDLCLAESTAENVRSSLTNADGPFALTVFLQESGGVMAHLDRYHFDSEVEPLPPLSAGPERRFVLAGARGAPTRGARRVHARALDDALVKLAELPALTEVRVQILPDDRFGAPALRESLAQWIRAHELRIADADD